MLPRGANDAEVVIEVADTGLGIEPAGRRAGLRPLLPRRPGDAEGFGLGLAIVAQAVRVSAETVSLRPGPAAARSPASRSRPQPHEARRDVGRNRMAPREPADPARRRRPGVRDVVSYALRREGFEVARPRDGEEALAQAHANRIDLVVLDVMLPGMSGIDVCRRSAPRAACRSSC